MELLLSKRKLWDTVNNYLYLIPLFCVLAITELFVPFDAQKEFNPYIGFTNYVSKIIPFVALGYAIFNLNHLKKLHLLFYLMPLCYFGFLVFESLYLYKSFVQYPHVALKIMNLFIAFGIYLFYKKHKNTNLTPMMHLIMIMLFVRIAMDPSIVSTSSFVGHERALHAPSIYLLLIPCLFFFNRYLVEFDNMALVKFAICLFFIIYFQHRTVWAATGGAFLFNLFLLRRQNALDLRKSLPTVLILIFVGLISASLLLTYLPSEVIGKLTENVTEIVNTESDKTGTKGWRMEQYKTYWPWVESHFVQGMRYEGFELPMQFYHSEAGTVVFEDLTGHHFHSFYYDILFYFGIIGIIMFFIIMLHPIYVVLRYNLTMDHRHISMISFSFSGLLFGVSYNYPDFYWTMFGLAFAYLEISKQKYNQKIQEEQIKEEGEEEEEIMTTARRHSYS